MTRWIFPLLLALASSAGHTQTVWRCGADGSRFQATPCADGRTLALLSAPPAAAVQEAEAVSRRERRALQTLAEERRTREREALQRGLEPAGIKPLKTAEDRPPKRPHKKSPPAPRWKALAPAA
jgi:hypothetical protein